MSSFVSSFPLYDAISAAFASALSTDSKSSAASAASSSIAEPKVALAVAKPNVSVAVDEPKVAVAVAEKKVAVAEPKVAVAEKKVKKAAVAQQKVAVAQQKVAVTQQKVADECQICCENLNKSSNKPVKCPYSDCAYIACVSCVRTYLIGNPQSAPHCMACKKPFDNLYLVQNLTKVWTFDTYFPYIYRTITDIELARLPEAMEEAERRKTINTLRNKLESLQAKRSTILEPINKLLNERDKKIKTVKNNLVYPSNNVRNDIIHDAIRKVERDTCIKISKIETDEYIEMKLQNRKDIIDTEKQLEDMNVPSKEKKERKVFTMPCSQNDCKGMLSTQYKCGLCDKYTCKDCHEPLQDEHKCNPDTVATAQAIKKDTRPCPNCNARIFKIEGCDQMWCTSCKTPFSWDTGKIVPNGQRIHNPHAIEYMRRNGVAVRAPGDLVCGGVMTYEQMEIMNNHIERMKPFLLDCNELEEKLKNKIPIKINNLTIITNIIIFIVRAWRIIDEVSRNKLRESREIAQAHRDFNEERVQYILNDINKETFTKIVTSHTREKNIETELSHIWELVSTFGIDMFNTLYQSANEIESYNNVYVEDVITFISLALQKIREFDALVKYANIQFATISVAHSISVPNIIYPVSDEYLESNDKIRLFRQEKYSQVGLKRLSEPQQ
jgi:uncharacterized CHY-type Zn-finger protein